MTSSLYEDLSVFLAHSVTLEQESAERLHELANAMEVHNNKVLFNLFIDLARYSEQHANNVKVMSKNVELPELKSWEYSWRDGESPEAFSYAGIHYLMSPGEALEKALEVEKKAESFYRDVAEKAADEEIHRLALDFCREEKNHVAAVQEKLGEFSPEARDALSPHGRTDRDPPVSQD